MKRKMKIKTITNEMISKEYRNIERETNKEN